MKILYCSTVCSLMTLNKLSKKSSYDLTSITVQKFHRLILRGLVLNEVPVETLSSIPPVSIVSNEKSSFESGIHYHYLKSLNLPVIRHICLSLGTLFNTFLWHLKTREKHVVVCDVLNISVCIGALLCKLFGVKVVGIMTDMPGLMISNSKRNHILSSFIKKVNLYILKKFDAYVFLTEAMNEAVNLNKRPYIVMEGLVDLESKNTEVNNKNKEFRNIMYAGGIYDKYGLSMLIEAFRKVKGDNLRLTLYGRLGEMPHDMEYYEKLDNRFCYKGIVSNAEIINEEISSVLLVNPRPSTEEFTKYSFPSKNMEYMLSGTPVLTMNLPGMPEEYKKYLFICKDESVQGLADSLTSILSMSDNDLQEMGINAKNFVLKHKNNRKQAKRIIDLCLKLI